MITRSLWWEFEFDLKYKSYDNYDKSNNQIASLLVFTILATPVAIIFDILTLPIQIMYYICLKIVNKIRR